MTDQQPTEESLEPTQARDPKPRREEPSHFDTPPRDLPGMDAPPVEDDGETIMIGA